MPKNSSRSIARKRFWSEHDKADYQCPDCGRANDEVEGTIEVHHKNGNAYDNRLENLVGVCKICHALREDRKPPKDTLRKALNSSRTEAAAPENSQLPFLYLRELDIKLCGNVNVYDSLFPDGQRFSEKMSVEKEDIGQVRPKTRREAALFRAGRIKTAVKVNELFKPLLQTARENCDCASCGCDYSEREEKDRSGLVAMPDELYKSPTDRLPFCGDCARGLLERESGSYEEIAEEMNASLESNQPLDSEELPDPAVKTTDQFEKCVHEGCEKDAALIYQFEPLPEDIGKNANLLTLWAGACSDCAGEIDDRFERGTIIGPKKHVLNSMRKLTSDHLGRS